MEIDTDEQVVVGEHEPDAVRIAVFDVGSCRLERRTRIGIGRRSVSADVNIDRAFVGFPSCGSSRQQSHWSYSRRAVGIPSLFGGDVFIGVSSVH